MTRNGRELMYRLKPVRRLGLEGSESVLVARQTTPASEVRKKSPHTRRTKTLYRPKKSDDTKRKTLPPLPPAPPVPELPRVPVEYAHVLLQRVQKWEKVLKNDSEDQDIAQATRAAIRRTCVEIINAYPKTTKNLNINERLWRSWYRDINKSATILKECSAFYSRLVEQLQSSVRRPDRLPEHVDGLKHSLQQSLVALGDVARYEQNLLSKGERDWTTARNFYLQALEVAPSNGKVYNQLGLLAVLEGKLLEGAYLYARSLVCELPFASVDNLLHVLQRGRSAESHQDASVGPPREAMETYSSHVLSCLHMIFTRENSTAKWNAASERMKAALDHLLDVCDQHDEVMPIDGPLLEDLSRALIHTICLSIALVHKTHHTDEKEVDLGNESAKKALAVGNVSVSSFMVKLAAVLSTTSESTRSKYFANAILPALNVYLDWLHLHQAVTTSIQKECVALFRVLSANGFIERGLCCTLKCEGDLSNTILREDRDLDGFLPYRNVHREFMPVKILSRQLTEEERLVVRIARFMTSSEKFALSRKAPKPAGSKSRKSTAPSRPRKVTTRTDQFAVDYIAPGRLCILCSNTSTFLDGECEFCGYEDDADFVTNDVEAVSQSSWIKEYDLAYDSNKSGLRKSSPSSPLRGSRTGSSPLSTSVSSSQSMPLLSPPRKLEDDFKTIMSIGTEYDTLVAGKDHQHLIVIDAPNVAMRHGKGKVFSCAGIELAANYFQALGHRVVGFIPDYMLQSNEERAEREQQGNVLTAAKIPDDAAFLERLVLKGVLIPTPPQDYDDSYAIHYAGLHNGYVVTNDLFRDHIVNMMGPRERKVAMRAWLRAHQISYSWVQNEFLPNPNFRFPESVGDTF